MSLALKSPFGIRSKLVFLSSFLLVIPWLGYQYILGMEDYLRRGQEQTVLGTAQALATALNERPELFNEGSYSPATRSEDLYVYPIYSPLSLVDSSLNDWGAYQQYEVAGAETDFVQMYMWFTGQYSPERYMHQGDFNFRGRIADYSRLWGAPVDFAHVLSYEHWPFEQARDEHGTARHGVQPFLADPFGLDEVPGGRKG